MAPKTMTSADDKGAAADTLICTMGTDRLSYRCLWRCLQMCLLLCSTSGCRRIAGTTRRDGHRLLEPRPPHKASAAVAIDATHALTLVGVGRGDTATGVLADGSPVRLQVVARGNKTGTAAARRPTACGVAAVDARR